MSATLPQISREYVKVSGITAFFEGTEADPTSLPVQAAIVPQNSYPEDSDFVSAQWVDTRTVRLLVGPGGALDPGPGQFTMWLRITGAVERPTRAVGAVVIRP